MKEQGYLEVRIVRRSHGHSVVRTAALNARVALFDDRLKDLQHNTRYAWELAANLALGASGRVERIDMGPRGDAATSNPRPA